MFRDQRRVRGPDGRDWADCLISRVSPAIGKGVCASRRTGRMFRYVHVVVDPELIWVDGRPTELLAVLRCRIGQWPQPVRLVAESDTRFEDVELVPCPHCADRTRPPDLVVYLARVGNLLKIGRTANLTVRIASLKGALLASAPGGAVEERELIDALTDYRVDGREWLRDLPEVEEHVRAYFRTLAEVAP